MSSIAAALADLLDRRIPLDRAIEHHFTSAYRQRTDGAWEDRAGFRAHIAHLRMFIAAAEVQVLDELVDGPRYAERHVVRLAKDDGGRVEQEVYVFGERADDGRFVRIEETTLMLRGLEEDRAVGSAKG